MNKKVMESNSNNYWKENVRIVFSLLMVWFIVSFGMSILFVDFLDEIKVFGFKLGFWMAQQGSIICFVVLIFIYVYKMNRLDLKYGLYEGEDHFKTKSE